MQRQVVHLQVDHSDDETETRSRKRKREVEVEQDESPTKKAKIADLDVLASVAVATIIVDSNENLTSPPFIKFKGTLYVQLAYFKNEINNSMIFDHASKDYFVKINSTFYIQVICLKNKINHAKIRYLFERYKAAKAANSKKSVADRVTPTFLLSKKLKQHASQKLFLSEKSLARINISDLIWKKIRQEKSHIISKPKIYNIIKKIFKHFQKSEQLTYNDLKNIRQEFFNVDFRFDRMISALFDLELIEQHATEAYCFVLMKEGKKHMIACGYTPYESARTFDSIFKFSKE